MKMSIPSGFTARFEIVCSRSSDRVGGPGSKNGRERPDWLLVDTVELSGERQVLMAGIAYRRRALPICLIGGRSAAEKRSNE